MRHCSSHEASTSYARPDLSDKPTPIPAEGVLFGAEDEHQPWNALPQRNRRRKRRSAYPLWVKYLGWCLGLAALVTATQIAVQLVRADPRDARVFAERELRLNALRANEQVVAEVRVWQRSAVDYYRATRGLLVLTNSPGDSANPVGGRIIYLGLQPRDPLSPRDAPPTFDEREWPVDTLVQVVPTRTLLYLAKGLSIVAPRERLTVGVPSPAEGAADSLMSALNGKYTALRAVGWQRREARRARDRARQEAAHAGRRAWYHVVARGEALASVAKMFGTTSEQLRALNGIVGDRIRIGQWLMVKGVTRQSVPFPAGITPDSTPHARLR